MPRSNLKQQPGEVGTPEPRVRPASLPKVVHHELADVVTFNPPVRCKGWVLEASEVGLLLRILSTLEQMRMCSTFEKDQRIKVVTSEFTVYGEIAFAVKNEIGTVDVGTRIVGFRAIA